VRRKLCVLSLWKPYQSVNSAGREITMPMGGTLPIQTSDDHILRLASHRDFWLVCSLVAVGLGVWLALGVALPTSDLIAASTQLGG
jgi:hypothetical protein